MNKIAIALFALVVVAAAEPPSSYGAPSFSSFSSGGYDDGGNEGAHLDADLLARVAQIIEQSESSSRGYSAPSNSYGPPSNSYGPPSNAYGAPARSGGIQLGRPERAHRVAEFDLSSGGHGGFRSGGYSGGYN